MYSRQAWKSQARRHPHSVFAGTLKALDKHQDLLSCRAFHAYSCDTFIVALYNIIKKVLARSVISDGEVFGY